MLKPLIYNVSELTESVQKLVQKLVQNLSNDVLLTSSQFVIKVMKLILCNYTLYLRTKRYLVYYHTWFFFETFALNFFIFTFVKYSLISMAIMRNWGPLHCRNIPINFLKIKFYKYFFKHLKKATYVHINLHVQSS